MSNSVAILPYKSSMDVIRSLEGTPPKLVLSTLVKLDLRDGHPK